MSTPCQSPGLMEVYDELLDATLDDVGRRGRKFDAFTTAVEACNSCHRREDCLREGLTAHAVGMFGGYLVTQRSYKP